MADWTLILLSEATTLPTEPQPTDLFNNFFRNKKSTKWDVFTEMISFHYILCGPIKRTVVDQLTKNVIWAKRILIAATFSLYLFGWFIFPDHADFVCSDVTSDNDLNQLMFIIRNSRLFAVNDDI